VPDLLLAPVELPQGRRVRGGLLSSASPLPDGWENGIAFRVVGCEPPTLLAPCEFGDTDEPGVRPGLAEFRPVFIRQSAACSTLSQVGTVNIALNRLEGTTEWALGYALATGALSGNPSLADAEVVSEVDAPSAAEGAVAAISCLEQAIADTGLGADAVIHAPYKAAAILVATGLVERVGDRFESPTGLTVIFSPGYPLVGGEESITLWATGAVFAGVSAGEVLVDGATGRPLADFRTNLDESLSQRLGLAAFDPCINLAASFAVPACNGDS
jgi:hypothetical protein